MANKQVYIGCGAGFAGDRSDAAIPVVSTLAKSDGTRYLIYEVMGERTLAIAQRIKQEQPERGYSPWLDSYLTESLKLCLDNQVRIVANFGNANPRAGAERVLELAAELNIQGVRVACVEGDDLLANIGIEELETLDTIEGTRIDQRELIGANAYLGAMPIARALSLDVDVVIVGRTTDAALVLGPLIHEFGWSTDQHDLLAAGTVAGHLLECGAQVSGGYFADPGFKDVPELDNVGFPIACVGVDGSLQITKADDTGGVVNRATVLEQLLYEVHDPFNYLTPDVIVDYSDITVDQLSPDRVAIKHVKGRAPTDTLKVTLSVDGGWLGEAEISYAGPNSLARARLAVEILTKRCDRKGITEPLRIEILGSGVVHDNDAGTRFNAEELDVDGEYRVRIAIRTASKTTAESVTNELLSLYCCGPAAGGGVRQTVSAQVSTASTLMDRNQIEQGVKVSEVICG